MHCCSFVDIFSSIDIDTFPVCIGRVQVDFLESDAERKRVLRGDDVLPLDPDVEVLEGHLEVVHDSCYHTGRHTLLLLLVFCRFLSNRKIDTS